MKSIVTNYFINMVSFSTLVFIVLFIISQDAMAAKNLPKGYSGVFNTCQNYGGEDRTFCCNNAEYTCINACGPFASRECIDACVDARQDCVRGIDVVEEAIIPDDIGPRVIRVKPARAGERPKLTPMPKMTPIENPEDPKHE